MRPKEELKGGDQEALQEAALHLQFLRQLTTNPLQCYKLYKMATSEDTVSLLLCSCYETFAD